MKISQPLVLLLGGLLSASSIGCAAINAVVGDVRPAPQENRGGSSERMVAIGRVFENQGRYDQAEVMYRRALKQSPQDAAIRSRLTHLAERKNSRQFQAEPAATAIAMADSINGAGKSRMKSAATDARISEPAEAETASTSAQETEFHEVELAAASDASTTRVSEAAEQKVELIATSQSAEAATVTAVTADEILAVIDAPAAHSELLIQGLKHGDSAESKSLAATLLGDCDSSSAEVTAALAEAAGTAEDERLRLAIAASRIQRGEQDASTVRQLIELLNSTDEEIRIQSVTELRHCGGLETNDECVHALSEMLDAESENVRAIAAVTLGDFSNLNSATSDRIKELSEADSSDEVREAATATVARCTDLGEACEDSTNFTP